MDWSARGGFVAYGVVYVVLGWLTGQLALGPSGDQVSQGGAFQQLAEQPLGVVVLWVACAGLAALVVWELIEAFAGHRRHEGLRRWVGRAGSVGRAGVFAVLSYSAAKAALGDGGSSGGSGTDTYTAKLMSMPFGPWLVGLVGVAILGFAVASIYQGLSDKWRDDFDFEGQTGNVGTALTVLAHVGYGARGVAFGVVGALFLWAALTHDARKSGGLDQALQQVKEAPFGPVLLLVVALGFLCYGVFNIAKVKHLSTR